MHYAQGLVSRGFPASALLRAWRKFAYEKLVHPTARRTLTNQFKEWILQQDFSAAHSDERSQQQAQYDKFLSQFKGTLLCGLAAVNHIFLHENMRQLTAQYMHEMAQSMAQKECGLLYSSNPDTVHDMAVDPRGNFAADTLLHVLETHTCKAIKRLNHFTIVKSPALLFGCGQHWQAVIRDK